MKRKLNDQESLTDQLFKDGFVKLHYPYLKSIEPIPHGFHKIFNPDQKRSQKPYRRKWLKSLEIFVRTELSLTGKSFNNWIMIRSLPGCKQQMAHCDFEPFNTSVPSSHLPLAMLVSIQPNTTLEVWPRCFHSNHCLADKVTVELDPGDVIVFRGDLVHAGSAYNSLNHRIHCYIDDVLIPRIRNQTWISKELNF